MEAVVGIGVRTGIDLALTEQNPFPPRFALSRTGSPIEVRLSSLTAVQQPSP